MAFRSRHVYRIASAIVPGLGQALAGRFRDAAMFFVAMLWIRGFLAAYVGGIGGATAVSLGDRAWGFAFGAPAIDGGFRIPWWSCSPGSSSACTCSPPGARAGHLAARGR